MQTVKYQKLMLSLLCMLAVTGCNTPYLVQPAGESLTKLNAQDSYNYKSTSISVVGSKQPYLGLSDPTTMEYTPAHFWPLDFVNYKIQQSVSLLSDLKERQQTCESKLYITSVDYSFLSGGPKGSYYVMVGFNAKLSIYSSNNQQLLENDISSGDVESEIVPLTLEFRPSARWEAARSKYINVSTRAAKVLVDKVLQTIDSVEQCQ